MTTAMLQTSTDSPSQQDNVITLPVWFHSEIGDARHPSQQTNTVSAALVVDLMDALTDIFVELPYNDLTGPLHAIDGILAELDSSDEWRSAGVDTASTIDKIASRFRRIAIEATVRRNPPVQMQLTPNF